MRACRAINLIAALFLCPGWAADPTQRELEDQFAHSVQPFVESYCIKCHDAEKPKGDFDLSPYTTMAAVMRDHLHWESVLEKLESAEMPPEKAKKQPPAADRDTVIAWIKAARRHHALAHAGDPGPVLARRLSNAEYDYTIRDLTGADIRPTREFPVDPANQAGFDNSGESLAMSPALVKKYLDAARAVADHLVLKPDGVEFAPHPVVADTDRDKYFVLRIVDFYKRQPTDYADYFAAAWRYHHRVALNRPSMTLADAAAEAKISPKYLARVWSTLTDSTEAVGPIAKVRAMWRALPAPDPGTPASLRGSCEQLRDSVIALREKLIPEVPNLRASGIQGGSQTLVMWKNNQMAANRRRYSADALHQRAAGELTPDLPALAPALKRASETSPSSRDIGVFLPPAITTTASSATVKMAAAKNRADDPDLGVPADPAERARHEAAFTQFADVFPDAFYITERARVYMDAVKEQENAGRLLSAGLHSMTGFFRDDGPLYNLVLDGAGQREIDRLWQEFDFSASVPQRMHISMLWFERTDSNYLRDSEFDPYRPENKAALTQENIKKLAEIYLAKAQRNGASETVQQAITDHFSRVAANILRVEQQRAAAEPTHLQALQGFAERAWRRPLSAKERESIAAFYRESRKENGLEHEEAMRDSVASILMSPHFLYRVDLGQLASTPVTQSAEDATVRVEPLSDYALASRLSYFLWSTMPDAELLARAEAGDLHRPEVLAAQARRMLKDPRIRHFAVEFAGHWLDFRRFEEHNGVDRERFPAFDNALRAAMFEEPIRFFVDLVREDRSVLDFLHGDYTFVNAPLARHYRMPEVSSGPNDWVRIDHASQFGRGGLLPMSVFLTANSPGLRTSPVKRGYWVVRRVLGERIPPPPAVVPELPSDEKHLGDLTLREALAKHREDKSCASCHARFDSFGVVFEGYGAVGEQRKTDFAGHPVDTRAELPGGTQAEGFQGLRQYIAEHRQSDFIANFARKLLVYALGRSLIPSDDPLLDSMRARLQNNDYRFTNLVETIVTSPQFLNKRVPQGLAHQ